MAKEYKFGFVISGDSEKGTKSIKSVREEVAKLDGDTSKIKKNTRDWRSETDKQTSSLGKHNKVMQETKKLVFSLAGVAGIGLLARGFKDTVVETERLRGSLVTITGSTKAAVDEFDRLTEFAKETPFTLDQSVTAFIRLKSLGLDPSQRALMSYGNTASAMGKDMMQMIEAVADASTMEFERLKEFGIRAKQEADTVTFTFQGVSTTVAKNSQEIEEYLTRIGENQFGSAMADQMDRIPGLLSNLEDSVDGLFRKIGDTGGISAFGSAIRGASSAADFLADNVEVLYTGAEALAVILGGKLTASLVASGAALTSRVAASAAALKSEVALTAATLSLAEADLFAARTAAARTPGFYMNAQAMAALTAAESAATAATSAHSAAVTKYAAIASPTSLATRSLAGAMALVGGPVGVAAIAAFGVYKLADAYVEHNNKAAEAKTAAFLLEQGVFDAGEAAAVYATQLNTATQSLRGWVQAGGSLAAVAAKMLKDNLDDSADSAQEAAEAQSAAAKKTEEYIEQLYRQVEAAGMSDRAAAIFNAVTKDGIELKGEDAAAAATLAARLYDLQHESKEVADRSEEYVESLRDQYAALQMTARAATIYNAVLKVGTDATAEQIVEATTLAAKIYDLGVAQESAAAAVKELDKESSYAAKAVSQNWQRTHEALTSIYEDVAEDGGNAFEIIENAGVRAAKRILAEFAALKTMEFMGITTPSGFASSTGGGMLNAAIAGSGGLMGAGSGFLQGAFGYGQGAAGFMGAPTAAASAGMNAAALATNPAVLAVAALAIAAKNDFWKDPDDYKRSFAGMLTAPTAGAAGSTFSVDPFASGFRAQGIAHGADQSTATKYIDIYRELDSSIVTLIEELGGIADLSKATLAGVGIDGKFGTAGTFMGMGGKTTDADIAAMVNSYAGQLLAHVSGLDDTLMESVRAASTAEEAIAILNKAIEDQKEVSDAAQESVKAQIAAEEKLFAYRMDGINALSSELQSVMELQRSVQMSIYSAMGATPLFGTDTNGQLQALEYQRDLIISNHSAQIKAEEALHNQRIQLAQSFMDYTNSLRLGNFSSLSMGGKFDLAQSNFRSLSMAAQGGDSEALKQLQGAAEQYVTLADSMFASSGGRKDVVSEVLGIMDSLGQSLGSSQFDPSEANQALVDQLSALDSQLADINIGINNSIIAELKDMNLTLSELSPKMQDSLFGAIGQWIESQPSGESMIEALSGIKGSVDLLPPDIASYMAVALGSFLQANGNQQRTVESFSPGSIPSSVGQKVLADQGFNLGYSADEIANRVGEIRAQTNSDIDYFKQVGLEAIAGNVSSQQLADVLGFTQDQVLAAAAAAGLPAFINGGDHMGGFRIVGEGGPEIEAVGRARYFNANQTSQILNGGASNDAVVAELRAVREELAEIRGIHMTAAEITTSQGETANRSLEKISQNTSAKSAGVGSADFAKRA